MSFIFKNFTQSLTSIHYNSTTVKAASSTVCIPFWPSIQKCLQQLWDLLTINEAEESTSCTDTYSEKQKQKQEWKRNPEAYPPFFFFLMTKWLNNTFKALTDNGNCQCTGKGSISQSF